MATVLIGLGASAAVADMVVSTAVSVGLGLLQRALTPDTVVKQAGSRLSSSQIMVSTEGNPLPRLVGNMRFGGQVIWATTFKETVIETTDSSGGKGGPQNITESTAYSYSASFAVGICEGDAGMSLKRVWADGKALDLSKVTYRFYTGVSTQLPDSRIEVVEGVGRTPAFRGTCYVVFEDMPLDEYGRRIPQMTFEVNRRITSDDAKALENVLEAVSIMPSANEFGYGTTEFFNDDSEGNVDAQNVHFENGTSDMDISLDTLEVSASNVSSVSITVPWFGSTSDATTCVVAPKIESSSKNILPSDWRVSDLIRSTSGVVTQYGGNPAFAATPSDQAVREAVIEMKSRGFKVMFHPLLQMDMAGYPWCGRVVGVPANFIGACVPGDFGVWDGTEVPYTGPSEWTHRRMILHYAALLSDLMTSDDAFLVGSEMVGLSASQVSWGTAIASLVTDVKSVMAVGVKVSYAADWTEYKEAHLSSVWAVTDFIGINNHLPITDWRTIDEEVHLRSTFKEGVGAGEYWDYRYASDADRLTNTRTPITLASDRQKDIRSWSVANHPGDDIWFTRLGCSSINKGANQPSVFIDVKSDESGTPWFSNGKRNDAVMRLYLEATMEYWSDDGLVDVSNMFAWAWDMRPYPTFPTDTSSWSDGDDWSNGRWLNGRLGSASVADAVTEWCTRIGLSLSQIDVTGLAAITARVEGINVSSVVSPRGVLENLMVTYLFDAHESGGVIYFVRKSASSSVIVDIDDLILSREGSSYSLSRARDADLPDRVKIDFIDSSRNHEVGSVDGHSLTGDANRVDVFTSMAIISMGYARALADILLQEQWSARNGLQLRLPFSSTVSGNVYFNVVKPGVTVDLFDRTYKVVKVSIGDELNVEMIGYSSGIYDIVSYAESPSTNVPIVYYGSPVVVFMDMPLYDPDSANKWSPRVVARQTPWPGEVLVYKSDGSGGYGIDSSVPSASLIGELSGDLAAGDPWLWDKTSELNVRFFDKNAVVASLSELSVLNGGNSVAVMTPSGEWEILQFANAVLNLDGTFTLTNLLRGQLGTEPYMGTPSLTGATVVVLGSGTLINPLSGTNANLGLSLNLRYGPTSVDISDTRYSDVTVVPRGVAYRPYAPVQLKQWLSGSDIRLSWVRRTRFEGDTWDVTEVPLHEEDERYEIEILSGGTVVRLIEAINIFDPGYAEYTATMQIEDFGSTVDTVVWRMYQMSVTFGRGAVANG